MPLVTVIIPVYNARHMIRECLDSIAAQDFPRDEMQVVIGDNNSNDGTREIIQAEYPWIELAIAYDRGCGHARNAALAKAKGKYVCCTDSDCVIDPKWVSTLVAAFEAAPADVACLGGQTEPYRVSTPVEHFRHAWVRQEGLREGKGDYPYAETPNAAFRREVFDPSVVGLFDGSLGFPDADMGIRLKQAGLRVRYVPGAIVRHRNPVTTHELYKHRVKYGIFNVRLARKYPDIFGDVDSDSYLAARTSEAGRRIAKDIAIKAPLALAGFRKSEGTRLWPLFDALIAYANYVGVKREVLASRAAPPLSGQSPARC